MTLRNFRAGAIVFLLATMWVWQRYAVVQSGDRIAQVRARIAELIETRDALLAETTTLSARTRIESIAFAHLGLRPAADKQYRRLPERLGEDRAGSDSPVAGVTEGESTTHTQ